MIERQIETIEELHVFLTSLFMKSGRQAFRKFFIENYPAFMYRLRQSVPDITDGEELLCMLIFLKQSTSDIAAILGICRKSVKQTRYRLRSKIDIPSYTTLEDFVQQLINTDNKNKKTI